MTPLRFSLRQLEYFVAVADTGTISAAAERCLVSQAGVSLAVSELERALGVQLLVRRRAKGVALTASGQRLLASARAMLTDADELQAQARSLSGEIAGRLLLGCYTTLSPFLLPSIIEGFTRRFPRVTVEFVEGSQPELHRHLLEGTVEGALMYERDLPSDVAATMVRLVRPYLLLPEAHPQASAEAVSLRQVADEPMIMFDVPPSRENTEAVFRSAGVQPKVAHRTMNFEMVRCLVGRGFGYSLLFQRPARGFSYEGRPVVARRIADPIEPLGIVLAHLSGVRLTNRLQAMIDYCRSTRDSEARSTQAPAPRRPTAARGGADRAAVTSGTGDERAVR